MFINGADNTFDQAQGYAKYISDLVLVGGSNIHGVYNATHGKVTDGKECDMGLAFIATKPVRLLHEIWNDCIKNISPNAKILTIYTSQGGGIHVRNALLDYPDELSQRILLVGIAPAAYPFPETCNNERNYRAKAHRDPIPRIDRIGIQRAKETIIDLKSHSNAPLHDHCIQSPTYQRELFNRIETYKNSVGRKI